MKTSKTNNKVTNNQLVSAAKKDVKAISPFFYINSLTKLAKKNEYCESVNLREVAKIITDYTARFVNSNVRFGFNGDCLRKDSQGRFVYSIPRAMGTAVFATDGDEVVYTRDNRGRDIVRTDNGYKVLQPIPFTLNGFLSAYCEIVRMIDKAQAAVDKAAKETAKEYEKAKKGIIRDFNDGIIDEFQMAQRLSELKAKYAA